MTRKLIPFLIFAVVMLSGLASADIYSAEASAADLTSAAKAPGLTESDVEAWRNP